LCHFAEKLKKKNFSIKAFVWQIIDVKCLAKDEKIATESGSFFLWKKKTNLFKKLMKIFVAPREIKSYLSSNSEVPLGLHLKFLWFEK
jgi:hypothetical protein